MLYFSNNILAHFQNGELSDEFAASMDFCLAKDTQTDIAPSVLLGISNANVYDGYVGRGYPTNLKRTFIAIRKKGSEEVCHMTFKNCPFLQFAFYDNIFCLLMEIQVKLVEANECSLMSYHYNNCGKQKVDTSSENNTSMSTESARRLLFKEFGGKRSMKALDRKEKMKINVDIVKEQLDRTLLGLYCPDKKKTIWWPFSFC